MKNIQRVLKRVRDRKESSMTIDKSPSGKMISNDPYASPKDLGEGPSDGAFPSVTWLPSGRANDGS